MVERGERMPSDDRLLQLARNLELDERELLAMKYAAAHGAAAEVLLAPPEPELPRLRKLLLSTCDNVDEMRVELARGERTAIEHVVWQALLEYVLLPGFEADRYAPKPLRDRIARARKRGTSTTIDPWRFEEEAQTFVPWAKAQFVGWRLDVATLIISIRHSTDEGDVSTVPLVDRELRARMLESVGADPSAAPTLDLTPVTLASLLASEGLSTADVEEIVELVEFKKMRARRTAG